MARELPKSVLYKFMKNPGEGYFLLKENNLQNCQATDWPKSSRHLHIGCS